MGALGYSSITLTDLTETLPVFLTLESNKSNNIQKKNGSLYTPDFEKDGVIITPSLFIGSELKEFSKNGLYYIVNGETYDSIEENIIPGQIAINSEGQLVIKQNISESYEISAFIDNFTIEEHGYTTNVKSRNKISIFVLEESSSYTAIISSSRDHFDENNTDDITLTAQLYRGTTKLTDVKYSWDGLTDNDSSSNDSNISGTDSTLNISRSQINGTEVISCTMTDNSTDLSFIATKTIRDYVDEYRADLLPSSSLILTPNNPSVELTARIWHKTNIINNDENQSRFKYKWQLINSNGTMINELIETNRILTIDTSSEVFPKENFTIACTITIDGKTTASAYQNITYSPIEYTVNVEPKQVWLNVDSNGNYSGEHTFNFKFQLLDKEKNLIPREDSPDGFITEENWDINAETSSEDFWDYGLILTINETDVINDSQVFDFQYKYLGNDFSEEVYVIKNYAGKDGKPGQDGTNGASYTVDLSNSFHTFAGEQAHAIAGQTVSFQIQAYYGDQELAIENVSWKDAPSGLDINYNETNETVTLTTQSGDFLTKDGNIVFTITVEKKEGVGTLDFIKIFNYSINYNGKSYYLGFGDNNTITYSPSTQTYNPSSIIVKAYSRNINGEASIYTDGIIYYSFDRENWVELTEEYISNYSNINNIYVRLYSPLIDPSLNLEKNSSYLLDEETIPVLTSLDGVEIGGDNLLRWTKTMPIETNKWKLEGSNTYVTQEEDGDFTCTVFNKSVPYSYITTPKEKINEEYINKTFCFSCYVKIEDIQLETDAAMLALQLRLYDAFSDTTRAAYKLIGELSNRGASYPKFIYDEDLVENKWIKIYQTFTWGNFSDNNGKQPDGFDITGSSCKYFSLSFYSGSNSPTSTIKIKKPKLEIGNVPTEWSASPYDITYENISGTNLILENNGYELTLNSEVSQIQLNSSILSAGESYTLSWRNCVFSDIENLKFGYQIKTEKIEQEEGSEPTITVEYSNNNFSFSSKDSTNNFIHTFPPQTHNWFLTIYYGYFDNEGALKNFTNTNGSIFFSQIKLERGTTATDFFLTTSQINELATNITKNQTKEILSLPVIQGTVSFNTVQEFTAFLQETQNYGGRITETEGNLSAINDNFALSSSGLSIYRNAINIVTEGEDAPYIRIQAQSSSSDGSSSNNYLQLEDDKLVFYSEGTPVATMTQSILIIENSKLVTAEVTESFKIDKLKFQITDTGVGVVWDF